MLIELAEPGDIPALCCLLNQLFEQEAEFSPDPAAQQRGLTRIIADREIGAILVARNRQQVIGMVNLLYTVSTALGERVALLEDMVVHSDQRDTGVGSQLLEAALHFAAQNGCRRITLLTDANNDKAQRFYQRHGASADHR
ncbi:MAG: GNAT family N-acetyltransferase [Deltaproteobacteria bacterium]|nr:GNAT family N-acetyltransferase [Deltaproteobacteria bacterium]